MSTQIYKLVCACQAPARQLRSIFDILFSSIACVDIVYACVALGHGEVTLAMVWNVCVAAPSQFAQTRERMCARWKFYFREQKAANGSAMHGASITHTRGIRICGARVTIPIRLNAKQNKNWFLNIFNNPTKQNLVHARKKKKEIFSHRTNERKDHSVSFWYLVMANLLYLYEHWCHVIWCGRGRKIPHRWFQRTNHI